MITIGLTGKIASGKSEVAKTLSQKGIYIIDADKLAHQTYAPNTDGFDKVVQAFGEKIIDPEGTINRYRLGQLAFKDESSLSKLTKIVWPRTRERIMEVQRELKEKDTKVAVLEAAVLGEAGWDDLTNEIWRIVAPENVALNRLLWRNNLTLAEAKQRLAIHKAYETNLEVNVEIENNGDLVQLNNKVDAAWDEFRLRRGIEL